MCEGPPIPLVPIDALSEFAFSQATNSQVICGHGFPCDHDKRLTGPRGNRLEGRLQIVCERVNCAGHNEIAPIANDERVAVGSGARCATNSNGPTGASPIFYDDGLAER
jgi:hypothetical protein